MCPPLTEDAHAGAPLRFSVFRLRLGIRYQKYRILRFAQDDGFVIMLGLQVKTVTVRIYSNSTAVSRPERQA